MCVYECIHLATALARRVLLCVSVRACICCLHFCVENMSRDASRCFIFVVRELSAERRQCGGLGEGRAIVNEIKRIRSCKRRVARVHTRVILRCFIFAHGLSTVPHAAEYNQTVRTRRARACDDGRARMFVCVRTPATAQHVHGDATFPVKCMRPIIGRWSRVLIRIFCTSPSVRCRRLGPCTVVTVVFGQCGLMAFDVRSFLCLVLFADRDVCSLCRCVATKPQSDPNGRTTHSFVRLQLRSAFRELSLSHAV